LSRRGAPSRAKPQRKSVGHTQLHRPKGCEEHNAFLKSAWGTNRPSPISGGRVLASQECKGETNSGVAKRRAPRADSNHLISTPFIWDRPRGRSRGEEEESYRKTWMFSRSRLRGSRVKEVLNDSNLTNNVGLPHGRSGTHKTVSKRLVSSTSEHPIVKRPVEG